MGGQMLSQGTRLTEADSRPIPYTRAEFDWAHERPARDRVAVPGAGDTVLYRHEGWAEPTEATVLWVQPADDVDDPHLWSPQLDEAQRPMMLHQGQPLMVPKADPWPSLRLKTRYGVVETREARLRGSAGWLPLDWRARRRPVPVVSVGGEAPRGAGAEPAPGAGA